MLCFERCPSSSTSCRAECAPLKPGGRKSLFRENDCVCREYLAPVELLEGQSSPAKLLESCSMTIRRKILLFSALALGAFFAVVYLVSRFALQNGFARLESEAARENIHHLQNGLKNEQSQLEIMARDYAQWDRTYDFMEKRDPDYERSELSIDTFKIIHINLFVLMDDSGQVALYKNAGGWFPSNGDLQKIVEVQQRLQSGGSRDVPLSGILDLNGKLLLLAYQPVLTSRGAGKPRGTLVMAREFDEGMVSSMGRSIGFPVWLEPADSLAMANIHEVAWTDGANSARLESESTCSMSASGISLARLAAFWWGVLLVPSTWKGKNKADCFGDCSCSPVVSTVARCSYSSMKYSWRGSRA